MNILSTGWKEVSNFNSMGSLLSWVEISLTTFFVLVVADMNHMSQIALLFIGLFTFMISTLCMVAFLGWNKQITANKKIESKQAVGQGGYQKHQDEFLKVPLIDLREEAVKLGWDFSEGSEQSLEFSFAISQAALDFDVQFWGRKDVSDSEDKNRKSQLIPIDASHWVKFTVEPVQFASSLDNFYMRSFEFPSLDVKGFLDLHVHCDEAMTWLTKATDNFKNMDLKSLETER